MFVSGICFGQNDLPIYDDVQYVKNYDDYQSGFNEVFISSPFAKSELKVPTNLEFKGKKVKSVIYLYSNNNRNPKFGQSDLSANRYNNLLSELEGADFSDTKWSTQVQIGCGTISCSRKLDHGFIIEFEGEEAVMSHDNLEVQKRMITNDKDITLSFSQGTKIDVPANAFVDAFGNPNKERVYLHVQEAYSIEDIVKGNLFTVTNRGQYLESRGMINVEAYSGDKRLYLKPGKSLTVHLPKEVDEDFKFFKGEDQNGELVWTKPEPIVKFANDNSNNNQDPDNVDLEVIELERVDEDERLIQERKKQETIRVMSWGHTNGVLVNITVMIGNEEVQIWKSKSKESTLKNLGFRPTEILTIKNWFDILDVKMDKQMYDGNDENGREFVLGNFIIMGGNDHQVDDDISQIYKMNSLGWANVDRLAKTGPPRRLYVEQSDVKELEHFDISLVIPSQNMFIPGYEKQDGNYSFTHGDFEAKMPMPVGEFAYIIGIGTKNGVTYFHMKKIKLGENEIEKLALQPTDREEALSIIEKTL